MKKPIALVVAIAAMLATTVIATAPAHALSSTTTETCNTQTISPIRGNGQNPVQLGPRHVTPVLPEFDTSLGDLISARVTATAKAELLVGVTNNSGSTQTFTPRVGGVSFAGKVGANGYIDLGTVAVQPSLSVGAGQTAFTELLVAQNTQWKAYDAALWDTLGAWDAYVVIEDQFTDTSTFVWNATIDRVSFTTCVQFAYQPRVDRVAGADRFETSADIALAAYPTGADTVYIATGTNYPDALAAGPAAARADAPLLLVTADSIPAPVASALTTLDPSHIVVVGGTASIGTAVYAQLDALSDTIERVAGADRYETSRLLTERDFDSSDWVFIATGTNFPDALSAGPASFAYEAPIILVYGAASDLDEETADLVTELGAQMSVIVGGTATVSLGIQSDLDAIMPDAIRLAGADRYETSQLVNEYSFSSSGNGTAYFATGLGFPDALSGSAWAAANRAPLFVVQPTCVPDATLEELEDMSISDVVLLGGTAVLSPAVASFASCP